MASTSLHDHYDQPDLCGRILAALAAAGVAAEHLDLDDLARFDEFHIRGAAATAELAAVAGLQPGLAVLNLGSGLGGPARRLARDHGCLVTGVDLVPGYCAAADLLTRLTGLSDRVRFQAGDMRCLPYAAGSFDQVWSLHTLMNIPDRAALAAEVRRVLRPGGRVVLYEVCAGNGEPVHLPVPWAAAPRHSHLVTPDTLLAAFAAAGLPATRRQDRTAGAIAWLDELAAARGPTAPGPGEGLKRGLKHDLNLDLSLVMGPDAGLKSRNLGRNLREGRISLLQAVCTG